MKYRIRFSKTKHMRFVGHLDLQRFFQKAFIRAALPLSYSNGYHPHPILSFAAPLGVGITSDGEYLDLALEEMIDETKALNSINDQMPSGIKVLSIRLLEEGKTSAMACLSAADYLVSFKNEASIPLDFSKKAKNLLDQNEKLIVIKKTKKSEREIDIRPLIYRYEIKDNGDFYMLISTGSKENLQPLLVMEACLNAIGSPFSKDDFFVHRINMYEGDAPYELHSF